MEISNELFVLSVASSRKKYHFTNCNYFRYKKKLSLAWIIQRYPNRRLSISKRKTLFFYLCCSSTQLLIVA